MWGSGQAMISASHSAVIQNLINNCTGPEGYVPVTPTGVGKMMPADIFVARWEGGAPALTVTGPTGKVVVMKPAVAPTPVPTSLGRAMIAMTECNPMDASRFGAKGVPAATQAKFKAMRLAIEASAVHPEITDGGTKIWPIYIDLLRAEFDNGDLTVPYARYLWVLDCGGWDAGMIPNVLANANNAAQGRFGLMSPWETGNSANPYTGYVECKKWDQRAFNGVMAIVNAWRLAVLPKWGSDRAALSAQLALAAAQIKAAAQAAAAAKLRSGTIASPFMSTAIAAGLKKSTTVITTPTPPIAAIMIGLVLGAGALALYKHRRAL